MANIPAGAKRCSNNCGAEWHYAGTTCPKEKQSAGSGVDADLQSFMDELNSRNGAATLSHDDAADNVQDAMAEAIGKYWDNPDNPDAYDTAAEFADEFLDPREYRDEFREEYISEVIGRIEDTDDIAQEVSEATYGALEEGAAHPNDYLDVQFSDSAVKEKFRSIAEDIAGDYSHLSNDADPTYRGNRW